MAFKKLADVEVQNANIFWTNFSGVEGQYNPAGRRNFCVELDEQSAEDMEADGWNVKRRKPREGEEVGTPYLKVNVSWKNTNHQPDIYMVTSKKKILMDERTIGRLDSADIQRVDLLINPSYWSRPDGSEGYAAYVKTMYVTISEPKFAERYEDIPDDTDEVIPFN